MIRPKEISHFGLGEKGEQIRTREKREEKKKKKKITGMEPLKLSTDTCLGLYGI